MFLVWRSGGFFGDEKKKGGGKRIGSLEGKGRNESVSFSWTSLRVKSHKLLQFLKICRSFTIKPL